MYHDFVALAASPQEAAVTQARRDSKRIHNSAQRFSKTSEGAFPSSTKLYTTLDKAWRMGEILGNSAARKQAKTLKQEKPKAVFADKRILRSLRADLRRILREADRLDVDDPRIAGMRLRVRFVMEAAVKMAASSALEKALYSENTAKMWIATSAIPCSHCKRLDGMVVEWKKEFPKAFSDLKPLKAYRNTLLQPPRHPRCQCCVVAVPR